MKTVPHMSMHNRHLLPPRWKCSCTPSCVWAGEEPELTSGAGDPQAESESERAEDAEPAGVGPPLLRETAQTGAQPPAGSEAAPGETEPGATQVNHTHTQQQQHLVVL